MEDLNVVDLVFLDGYENPTVALICKVGSDFNFLIYF